MKTFEEFLAEKHAEEYEGIKDDMPDAFNEWLELEADVWLKYAEEWHDKIIFDIREDVEKLGKILNS